LTSKSDLLKFAIKIAKEAGKIHMSYFGNISSLENKSTNIDLLTNADTESEEYILKSIQNNFPYHSILSEEQPELKKNSEYTWVIDPLDGTTNFVHKLPIFSCSIGLKKNNKTILGVVYNPAANKCFYAEKNKGAFLNDKPIAPTSSNTLSECLLVTGFPYKHDEKYDLLFSIFKDFYDITRGVRRLGAASLDLCFVAMGRFDGFYEYGLKPWDVCGGEIILKEAGGMISDWDSVNKHPSNCSRILASNKFIHKEMSNILLDEKYKIFID